MAIRIRQNEVGVFFFTFFNLQVITTAHARKSGVIFHFSNSFQSKKLIIKGAVSRYSVIFCSFFARAKNGDCSHKCRGHQTITARSATRTTSPAKLSQANVFFSSNCRFLRSCLAAAIIFPTHKMAAKNHRLS